MIYCFDLDGTLCHTEGSDYPRAIPMQERIDAVNELYENGHTIYIDRSFNSVHWLQSMDRIRRIGQKKSPIIEVLVHENTIDNRVEDRLNQKIELMKKILNDPSISVEMKNYNTAFLDDGDYQFSMEKDIDEEDIHYVIDSLKEE